MPRSSQPAPSGSSAPLAAVRTRSARLVSVALAALLVIALLIGFAVSPYLFAGTTLQSEIDTQLRQTTGLVIAAGRQARFELLPSPHVSMAAVSIVDPAGTLSINADFLSGGVRFLPLLVGRIELSTATLVRPRLTIDVDGRPMRPDNTIGHALRFPHDADRASKRLGTVTLVDGTAIVRSRSLPNTPTFEHVNITVDWRNLDAPATLTGTLSVRKIDAEIDAWVAQPFALMRSEPSAVALRVHALPLDLSANGTLVDAATPRFQGSVSSSAPSLPALLALGGYQGATPAPFANMHLTSDTAIASVDAGGRLAIDLAGLRLHLDDNDYEGTLALQTGSRSSLSGTLAAERLLLAPFLKRLPKLVRDGTKQWGRNEIELDRGDPLDLDLRISASHLKVAPLTIDDGALAVMTRNGRTEVSLVEGKAYGGSVKARMSIGVSRAGLSLRGAGSLTDADAATLSWDAFGRQFAAGTFSVSGSVETNGDTPAALMAHLQGWARGRAKDGEISGIDLAKGLQLTNDKSIALALPALRAGRTPFSTIDFGLRLADGIATIDEAALSGTKATLTVAGSADIGARRLDLQATAAEPPATPALAKPPLPLRFDVKGSFDQVIVAPARNAAASPTAP